METGRFSLKRKIKSLIPSQMTIRGMASANTSGVWWISWALYDLPEKYAGEVTTVMKKLRKREDSKLEDHEALLRHTGTHTTRTHTQKQSDWRKDERVAWYLWYLCYSLVRTSSCTCCHQNCMLPGSRNPKRFRFSPFSERVFSSFKWSHMQCLLSLLSS